MPRHGGSVGHQKARTAHFIYVPKHKYCQLPPPTPPHDHTVLAPPHLVRYQPSTNRPHTHPTFEHKTTHKTEKERTGEKERKREDDREGERERERERKRERAREPRHTEIRRAPMPSPYPLSFLTVGGWAILHPLTCSQISYTPPPTVPPPNIPTLSGPPTGDGPVTAGAASVSAATMRRAARSRLFLRARGRQRAGGGGGGGSWSRRGRVGGLTVRLPCSAKSRLLTTPFLELPSRGTGEGGGLRIMRPGRAFAELIVGRATYAAGEGCRRKVSFS